MDFFDFEDFDDFEQEEDPLSDTMLENEEEPKEDYFDIEDAMFWGGFVWTMAEEEREERRRRKKLSHDEKEKDLQL